MAKDRNEINVHCRHCDGCGGESHRNTAGATWGKLCPACDEADLLATWCEEEARVAQPQRLPAHDAVAQTWEAAADLIRNTN